LNDVGIGRERERASAAVVDDNDDDDASLSGKPRQVRHERRERELN
jgi:hypothetical protein